MEINSLTGIYWMINMTQHNEARSLRHYLSNKYIILLSLKHPDIENKLFLTSCFCLLLCFCFFSSAQVAGQPRPGSWPKENQTNKNKNTPSVLDINFDLSIGLEGKDWMSQIWWPRTQSFLNLQMGTHLWAAGRAPLSMYWCTPKFFLLLAVCCLKHHGAAESP